MNFKGIFICNRKSSSLEKKNSVHIKKLQKNSKKYETKYSAN